MDYATSYSHHSQGGGVGGLVHPWHGYPLGCSSEAFEIVLQQAYRVVDIIVNDCQIEQMSISLTEGVWVFGKPLNSFILLKKHNNTRWQAFQENHSEFGDFANSFPPKSFKFMFGLFSLALSSLPLGVLKQKSK